MPEKINENGTTIRVHRVGTITTGLTFVAFGLLFMVHTMFGLFTYSSIMSIWPLVLIALGVEVLLASGLKEKFVYDKAGAFMMIIMSLFAMTMAFAEMCLQHVELFR